MNSYYLAAMKTRRPTWGEAVWLKRIARSPLVKTYRADGDVAFALSDGTPVPLAVAERLIDKGWVRGERDGIWGDVRSHGPTGHRYEALKPRGL